MNEGGITPVMSMNPGYGSGFGFGNEGIWLFLAGFRQISNLKP